MSLRYLSNFFKNKEGKSNESTKQTEVSLIENRLKEIEARVYVVVTKIENMDLAKKQHPELYNPMKKSYDLLRNTLSKELVELRVEKANLETQKTDMEQNAPIIRQLPNLN